MQEEKTDVTLACTPRLAPIVSDGVTPPAQDGSAPSLHQVERSASALLLEEAIGIRWNDSRRAWWILESHRFHCIKRQLHLHIEEGEDLD